MTCPYLTYRRFEGSVPELAHERAFCRIQGEFVSPMKADVCNGRDRFSHATHCDVLEQHVSDELEDGQRR